MRRWKTSLSHSRVVICARGAMGSRNYWPIWQLTISRMRVFYREPAAVFWVYGFPLVMALSLGMAFREDAKETIRVDLVEQHVQSQTDGNSKSENQNVKSAFSDP